MMRSHPDGVVILVHAQPGAKRNGVAGVHGGMLKLAVTAPPDKGRANEALAALLAELLKVKPRQVELLQGHAHRNKQFLVHGMSLAMAKSLLPPEK